MFCEKFPPYNVSGTARPYYFAKYLPQFGYAPTVISSELPAGETPDWGLLEQLPREVECHRVRPLLRFAFQAAREKRSKVAASSGQRTSGQRATAEANGSSRARIQSRIEEVRWAMTCLVDWNLPAGLVGAQHIAKADLIWATAPHPRNLVPPYLLSKLWNKPFIIDLRDPWTYGSLWNPATERVAVWEKALAARVLGHAQRIVLTSPLTMQEMQKRFPHAASRMLTITNGYVEIDVPAERTLGGDKFLLRYIGMLNERRTPDVLLEALKLALQDDELARDLRFEFIGSMGNHQAKLADPALKGTVSALGTVPYERSLALIKGSDVNVLLQTIDEGHDVIAGKTFEYLAAARPILGIVDERGGDAWLLNQVKAGVIVGWRDSRQIAAEIRGLWQLWRDQQLSNRFASTDVSQYTRGALTKQLADLFDHELQMATSTGSLRA
jgi:glycosyltransferase involved in cell wall biosynthesis